MNPDINAQRVAALLRGDERTTCWQCGKEKLKHVLRGGSFSYFANYLPGSYPSYFDPELQFDYFGFRVVWLSGAEHTICWSCWHELDYGQPQ